MGDDNASSVPAWQSPVTPVRKLTADESRDLELKVAEILQANASADEEDVRLLLDFTIAMANNQKPVKIT